MECSGNVLRSLWVFNKHSPGPHFVGICDVKRPPISFGREFIPKCSLFTAVATPVPPVK